VLDLELVDECVLPDDLSCMFARSSALNESYHGIGHRPCAAGSRSRAHSHQRSSGANDRIAERLAAFKNYFQERFEKGFEYSFVVPPRRRLRRECPTTRGDALPHGQPDVANGGHAPLQHREYREEDRRALFRIGKYASKLEPAPGQRRKLRGSRGVATGQGGDAPGIRPLWREQRRYFDVRCGESVGSVGKRGGRGALRVYPPQRAASRSAAAAPSTAAPVRPA
jgi:hypothetical protein